MNIIEEKINKVIENGIVCSMGRCWWICYKIWSRMSKDIKSKLVLAEGKNHYWLEDKDGNIYDPYSIVYDIDTSVYDYKAISRHNIEKLRFSDTFNERFCESSKSGKTIGIRKIFQFSNESIEESRI